MILALEREHVAGVDASQMLMLRAPSIWARGFYERFGHPADVLDHAIAQHDDDRVLLGQDEGGYLCYRCRNIHLG
jgi:hypothetical protein